MNITLVKQNLRFVWLGLIITCLGYYFYNPEFFNQNNLAEFFGQYANYGLFILFLLHIFRGFTMLPPTLLIFAGVIMYPNNLEILLLVSILGATVSGAVTYYFSDKLDLKVWLKKHKATYDKIKKGLQSKYGQLVVVSWVLFPLVPTDIVGYASGAIKMNFVKYISAYFVGKSMLCIIYIYGGEFILGYLLN